MSIWADFAKGGAEGLFSGVGAMAKDLREAITGDVSSEDKAKLQQKAMELELAVQTAQMQMITAEANSSDKWTSRARPSFMYVFYFILLALIIVAPFVGIFYPVGMQQFFVNVQAGFNAIPDSLYALFGTGYCGYTAARTWEKNKAVGK